MTDNTPRVEQILAGWPSTLDTMSDARKMQQMVDFARTLERENAALRSALEECEKYLTLICRVICPDNPPPHGESMLSKARAALGGKT